MKEERRAKSEKKRERKSKTFSFMTFWNEKKIVRDILEWDKKSETFSLSPGWWLPIAILEMNFIVFLQ